MTKRCPGKCGRMLHTDDRICSSCKAKLSTRQRAQLDSGVDITSILNTSASYDSGSYSGGYSAGDGGGGCD